MAVHVRARAARLIDGALCELQQIVAAREGGGALERRVEQPALARPALEQRHLARVRLRLRVRGRVGVRARVRVSVRVSVGVRARVRVSVRVMAPAWPLGRSG